MLINVTIHVWIIEKFVFDVYKHTISFKKWIN